MTTAEAVVKDVSILAAAVVVAIILVIAVSVALLVRLLRDVAGAAGKAAPTYECVAWRRQRERAGGLSASGS
jgi:hypothetical protein